MYSFALGRYVRVMTLGCSVLLIRRADIIRGIPFASLDDVLKFKQAYNGPKHWADIELIEKYLTAQNH
jgi:hypothetical protein